MSRADELRAELALAELEDKLIQAKATKAGATPELKADLRAARQAYRELREAGDPADGAVRPGTIRATAKARGN